jgi:hypothetical protein
MKVTEILAEHGLEIDDVRWYLAALLSTRLLAYRDEPAELTRLIWSGKLEADLYDAEERFLRELDRKLDSSRADEHTVTEIVREIEREKKRRA